VLKVYYKLVRGELLVLSGEEEVLVQIVWIAIAIGEEGPAWII
jgi:hypothetical protein